MRFEASFRPSSLTLAFSGGLKCSKVVGMTGFEPAIPLTPSELSPFFHPQSLVFTRSLTTYVAGTYTVNRLVLWRSAHRVVCRDFVTSVLPQMPVRGSSFYHLSPNQGVVVITKVCYHVLPRRR
jgi:hypothetical protein